MTVRIATLCWIFVSVLLGPSTAWPGGSAENAVLIIDPSDPVALAVGHHYRAARNIPDCNVIYFDPVAVSWEAHRAFQELAVDGTLRARGIDGFIDYVVVAPVSKFFVPESTGLIDDGCHPVRRFSLSFVYSSAFIGDAIDRGGLPSNHRNHYFAANSDAIAFDSQTRWHRGSPVPRVDAPRYRIGALLGFTGPGGNTAEELVAMIDRSVASDGSEPDGRVYFMRTTDAGRSSPREALFPRGLDALQAVGGDGRILDAVLPNGRHDIMGLMTGWPEPEISTADFTLRRGAFCDHLTSFAATFDDVRQTKIADWIGRGASGSVGTVEEPCNYPGKFPHPKVHALYRQGSTLGEAVFRSLEFLPFQGLLYGDPLTRPYATPPTVDVDGLPSSAVSGAFELTARASSDNAEIEGFQLYLDGRPVGDWVPGDASWWIDTSRLADGVHEVRVVAYDDSPVRNQGRWIGHFRSLRHAQAVNLSIEPKVGDLSTTFRFDAAALGVPTEIQLVAHGRVIAAGGFNPDRWELTGASVGAGPMEIRARALYGDGSSAWSDPVSVQIDLEYPPSGEAGVHAPDAFGYRRRLTSDAPILLELPADDRDGSQLRFEIVDPPHQGSLRGTGPHRLYVPPIDGCGEDRFTFRVSDGAQTSKLATIRLELPQRPFVRGDLDGDMDVDPVDAAILALRLFSNPRQLSASADLDADGHVRFRDLRLLIAHLYRDGSPPAAPHPRVGCP